VGCHTRDGKLWDESPHAHAWQTLADRGYQVDAACQRCHTNGYGLPSGFLSVARSPQARTVGCESCHGPALAHSREPKIKTPFAARDQCTHCHDRENSPRFADEAYWQRIRHGTPVTAESRMQQRTK
jgi:hypothetical protein